MKKSIRILSLFLAFIMLFGLASCGGEESVPTTEKATSEEPAPMSETETAEPVSEEKLPEYVSPYTGLETTAELASKRPVAVMLNTIKVAMPQRGLSHCDIIYEVLAEGGIIRLCGIVQDYENCGDLGSMRSARPYYAQLALANDAIYIHAGGSHQGKDFIKNHKMQDVDALTTGSVNGVQIFWRDPERKARMAIEHTMFTSGQNLAVAISQKGYRTTLLDPNFRAFKFLTKEADLAAGTSAFYMRVPHSASTVSEFTYNATTGLYEHKLYSAAHIDEVNGEQVATKNVLMLFAAEKNYPGEAYLDITLVGQGSGYYFTNGKTVPITWKRASEDGTFTYLTENGEELEVNPGRSYVVVVDQKTKPNVTIS